MRKHYELVIKDTDRQVKKALRIQIIDPGSPDCGAFPDDNDLLEAKFAVYRLTTMTAAYSNSDSQWFKNPLVADRVLMALSYTERVQHEDGLFDFIDCNFHSAPDTAFIVKRMLPCLHYLHGHERDEWQEQIYNKLYSIGKKAARGLTEGGFHTPNHRWAIASNLIECADFFEMPELAQMANQYLAEGIDCNEDGEFSERSAGNYNRINNDAMITLGNYTGEDRFYDYAVRNLRMMLTYMEPDGTVFTSNSTRQDNGKRIYPIDYYWEYLTMGIDRKIPEFIGFANHLFELVQEYQLHCPDILIQFMNRPELISEEHEDRYIRKDFNCLYTKSGIARVSRSDTTYTLMRGKSNFLYFSNASIDVMLKVGGSFCEHRAFVPETLTRTEDGFELTQVMHGWYYLPFTEPQGTSDWWEMDHTKRPKKYGPDLSLYVRVREIPEGIAVTIRLSGVEHAPFRIEAAVVGADKADNDAFAMRDLKNRKLVVKSGMTLLSNREHSLEIGPGFGAHTFTAGKFGSEGSDSNCCTLYFTDYTPFEHTLVLKNQVIAQ